MATPAVGEDIEALCGRCGTVWHVVMAKMGDKIAKVVCKRCNGHHLYRTEQPPESADGASTATSAGAAARPLAARRSRARTVAPVQAPIPPFDPSKPPRPYSAAQPFVAGERVQHATFGAGVVTGSPGPGKVEIAFPGGRRVLASARVASTLERPSFVKNVPIADRPPDKPL